MRSRSGVGFVEILLVTALILLFGITTFTLVTAGGDAYRKILDKRDSDITLRTALSYLTTQLRQHDREGDVSIVEGDVGDLIVLKWDENGYEYETRVYWHDGWLKEETTIPELPQDPENATNITRLSSFSCLPVQGTSAVLLSVAIGEGEETQTRETVVSLNAAGRQR